MIDGDCRVKGILLAAISIVAFIVVFLYNTQPLFQSNGKILREFQKKIEVAFRVQSLDSYPHASSCQALFRTADQYTVRIDNETYPKSVPLFYNSSINFECLNQNQKKPLILFWNEFFSDPYYSYKNNSFENNGCPVTNCETTVDKKRYDEASLVVTHMRNSFDLQEFPKYRPDYLRTVFLLYESPYHSPDFTQYNGFYNMTSTYKLDSDFAHFYEDGMRWKKNANFKKSFDFHGQKKGMAAALISNCNDRSGRLEYIKKLSEHMRVDIYGNCGDKKCPETFANGTKGNCRAILAEDYKFFLAFENSICDGYITEKFFSTLRYNTIPVVHGGGHYEQLIPKSGYLNTRDFSSAQKLADRLKELAENKSAYNSFFKWKEHVTFEKPVTFSSVCSMCIQLNLEQKMNTGIKKSIIENIGDYWNRDKNCRPFLL